MTVVNARSHCWTALICTSLLSSCIYFGTDSSSVPPTLTGPTNDAQPSWIQVYFTDPESPSSSHFEDGPDESLAAAIDSARLTVDVAIYNLNLWSIRNALLDAHARGVVVRVVAESDNLDGEEFQALIAAGIPVLGDRREGSMHNKFVVIDHSEVWTGSMNFTLNGAYDDNNNLICLRAPQIAADYLVEFDEMFDEDLFGDDILAITPHPQIQVEDTLVEVYFSPDDSVQSRLLELLETASKSIYFLAYSFTADELGEAVRSRATAGVKVAGVVDEGQGISNTGSEFDAFLQAGLDVRLDGLDGLMHHKVIIIDEQIIVTGSYNFSRNAEETNDENVLIIHDPATASSFLEEFWRIYYQSLQP